MYTRSVTDESGNEKVMAFCRGTSRFEAGSRFKYMPEYFELSYKNLVNAIGEAIDKQEKEEGSEFFTEEIQNAYKDTTSELDYDALVAEFNNLITTIPGFNSEPDTPEGAKFKDYWAPVIKQITEKYLGKGNTITKSSRDQVEAISLVVSELKDTIKYKEM